MRPARPQSWLEEHGARVGGTVRLSLEEFGAVGEFDVLAIAPSTIRRPAAPGLVTGVFRHSHAHVVDVTLPGGETLGITPGHPVWCTERHGWTPVAELQPGDHLWTKHGPTPIESIEPRHEPVEVVTLEVEGDHVFRVESSEILVHNASVGLDAELGQEVLKRLGCDVVETLDRESLAPGWRGRAKFSGRGFGVIYLLVVNGKVMKVGKTRTQSAHGRWEKYLYAQRECGGVEVIAWAFDESCVTTLDRAETAVRNAFCGEQSDCPWDNTHERLGRGGPGVPGEKVSDPSIGYWCNCDWVSTIP